MKRHLTKRLVAATALGVVALAPLAANADPAANNADLASRIRNGRALSTNRAVLAEQERQTRIIQEQLAALQAAPQTMTFGAGDAFAQLPVPNGGFPQGGGLVVNNTTVQVNIQNGSGNVAGNTAQSTQQQSVEAGE